MPLISYNAAMSTCGGGIATKADEELTELRNQMQAFEWDESYLFLMHEDTGIGPKLALRFQELAGVES